ALLGLSVSSANASLVSGNTTFGVDTTTIDTVSGLEWLDLQWSADMSFNDVKDEFGSGGLFEGWRYATLGEVATFWSNSGGGGGSYAGDADAWVEGIFGYWATSVAGVENAYFLTAEEGGTQGSHVYGLLADYSNQVPKPNSESLAYVNSAQIEHSSRRFDTGSALVKVTVVPVPAAIWLFGTALIGFVGISRRRKLA
ncbi:MAG: VPLPA-CTERM sorting domain-containing protein, partial [Planctomycetaceae bacterium]|nr:VPLPA-CTERM sorting domain-containing protein [Planctomycetaceae bacterium]